MTQNMVDVAASVPGDEPSWKQRAVERSTRAAKLRAEQRVQRFLDAAQAIITDTGSTDFTVQDVVNRSSQSLRSFYQHFDGKHELLLALFEDALRRATSQIAAATDTKAAPIDALRTAVQLLFELSRPDPGAHRPLFTEFAPRLLLSHPAEVRRAHAPLLELLTTLTGRAAEAGQLRPGTEPRRIAALTMQTVMFTAQTSGGADPEETVRPVTGDEIWDFIAHGIAQALSMSPRPRPTMKEILHDKLRESRAALMSRVDGLGEYDLRRPMTASGTNLLGLVKHLAGLEYGYLGESLGRPGPETLPWVEDGSIWDGADLWARPDESSRYLIGLYRRGCEHADRVIDDLDLDSPARVAHWPEAERDTTLGFLLVRMVAETAQHAGHADIVRELIDGRGGPDHDLVDDAGWRDYVARVAAAAETFRSAR